MCSRSSRRTGTLAWAANTSGPSGGGSAADGGPGGRNGSVASPNECGTPSSAASAVNSAISRWLCRQNTSHPARRVMARGVAGTLIPGRPLTSTGRSTPRSTGAAVSAATTGPEAASRTTSGRSSCSLRSTAG